MKTHFICLANSLKMQGRCVAGIEIVLKENSYTIVKNDDGTPKWIRPISLTEHGELYPHKTADIKLLDIIEVDITEHCPKHAQSENVYFFKLTHTHRHIKPVAKVLDMLCDKKQVNILGNTDKTVDHSTFCNTITRSLMFIKPENVVFYHEKTESRPRPRVKFTYLGTQYNLPLTDPVYIQLLQANDPSVYDESSTYYFTISIGELYEKTGFHYKLVAGVVKCDN